MREVVNRQKRAGGSQLTVGKRSTCKKVNSVFEKPIITFYNLWCRTKKQFCFENLAFFFCGETHKPPSLPFFSHQSSPLTFRVSKRRKENTSDPWLDRKKRPIIILHKNTADSLSFFSFEGKRFFRNNESLFPFVHIKIYFWRPLMTPRHLEKWNCHLRGTTQWALPKRTLFWVLSSPGGLLIHLEGKEKIEALSLPISPLPHV